jgi:hypothetical protein
MKTTKVYSSSAFALMFARPANYFVDSSQAQLDLLSVPELQKLLNYMAYVVYPTIFKKSLQYKDKESSSFIKDQLIATIFKKSFQYKDKESSSFIKDQLIVTTKFILERKYTLLMILAHQRRNRGMKDLLPLFEEPK